MKVIAKVRLREIDFLRGIAIILVLLHHQKLFQFTTTMGWIGVDLFFVISGFLVSGLLFKEYIKFGNINPRLFLIRRGFKIYPIYYLSYLLYLILIITEHRFNLKGFLADMFFVQNYVRGWGYAYAASWSLAIEEHFYFLFSIFIWLGIRKKWFVLNEGLTSSKITNFETAILSIMLLCLILRISQNLLFSYNVIKNATMSHLRMDSLFSGVLVSYLYYFRNSFLINFFSKNSLVLLVLSVLLLSFTPFVSPQDSMFLRNYGFVFLYIAFGILLIFFLVETKINSILNKYFGTKIVDIICKIGFSSYSIYIIHSLVNMLFNRLDVAMFFPFPFLITTTLSVIFGIVMTEYVENYFLKIRDKHFPSRTS